MKNRTVTIFLMFVLLISCTPFSQPVTFTPTSTFTPTLTATTTPTPTITLTAAKTLTPTPVLPSLVFEEDFVSDPLGWKSIYNNPYGDLKFSYSNDGLDFRYEARGDYEYPRRGANVIAINDDFDVEVVLDRRVRLSGLWFSNGALTQNSSDNWFYVLIEQGPSVKNWEKEKAHLGTYQPSSQYRGYFQYGSHPLVGEIDDFITNQNGEIHLRLSFRGNQLNASVNGSPIITDTNRLYAGKKYFMGFLIGAQDHFIVKDLQFWIVNKENFGIVSAVDVASKEAAPTFDALLSATPIIQSNTATPITLTSPALPTIDSFVGTWLLQRFRTYDDTWENPRVAQKVRITKKEKVIIVQHLAQCNGEVYCDVGTFSTTFEGGPIILFEDFGFCIIKNIISLEGNLLHVMGFTHFTDASGRLDYISEYYYRK